MVAAMRFGTVGETMHLGNITDSLEIDRLEELSFKLTYHQFLQEQERTTAKDRNG